MAYFSPINNRLILKNHQSFKALYKNQTLDLRYEEKLTYALWKNMKIDTWSTTRSLGSPSKHPHHHHHPHPSPYTEKMRVYRRRDKPECVCLQYFPPPLFFPLAHTLFYFFFLFRHGISRGRLQRDSLSQRPCISKRGCALLLLLLFLDRFARLVWALFFSFRNFKSACQHVQEEGRRKGTHSINFYYFVRTCGSNAYREISKKFGGINFFIGNFWIIAGNFFISRMIFFCPIVPSKRFEWNILKKITIIIFFLSSI